MGLVYKHKAKHMNHNRWIREMPHCVYFDKRDQANRRYMHVQAWNQNEMISWLMANTKKITVVSKYDKNYRHSIYGYRVVRGRRYHTWLFSDKNTALLFKLVWG